MKPDWWGSFIDLKSSQSIEIKRQKLVMYFSSYIGGLILLLFSLQHFENENSLLFSILLTSAAVVLSNVVLSHFHRYFKVSLYITGAGVSGLILGLVITGGHENTALYWLFPFPLVYFILFGYRQGLIVNLALFAVVLQLLYQPQWLLAEYRTDEKSRFIASYLVTVFLAFVAEYFRFRSHKELSSINLHRQKQANMDPLTKLPNRRFLDSVYFNKTKNADSGRFPMTVIVADLDFFKKVNDNYGHDIGDKVLIHVADLFKTHVRELDVVARVGGEEFLILLPHTQLVDALNVAEKIRACIAAHPYQCIEEKECRIEMTVSIGVAEATTIEQLNEAILCADEHLYAAKRNGRNCVIHQTY
ncbi:hypothetical protein PULV_a2443 [Pseudoalteromonas ulvae UL12]|uniref:diguanylate cyclase n=1 Tax=Pseudoalteromonas ulvae TaxID=107327 RepID=A0A2C9ZZG0_PSEDV|nr:GGDEF domain-containing protein [Pseudoalteromonas ulvae]MBE0364696.1 hypothetical protein [Pseudoalteromonas ulvae UL12]OUL56161.1 hypothetical protein B1199_18795 [Pseudoalteromonas ulvae]